MRKNELRRFANNQLNADKRGTYLDRKHRVFVINKVIHDLFKLGQPPRTWHGLTEEHIQSLVTHWNKQQINTITIMKYMTFIRYFLSLISHQIDGIDNKKLGLSRTIRQGKHLPLATDILEQLSHPIAKIIFQLQSEEYRKNKSPTSNILMALTDERYHEIELK